MRKVRRLEPKRNRLVCVACSRAIHRHERYEIIVVRHRDCGDPKMVGQRSIAGMSPGSSSDDPSPQADSSPLFPDPAST